MKSRAGAEPRVAADPREAFTYCAETGGLLVLEYAGPEWLPVVRDLRSLCGDAISVVVVVGQERLAEIGGLQRAGADEVVAWDGRADPVAWAVERILAARGGGVAPGAAAAATPVHGFTAPSPTPPVLHRVPAPAPTAAAPASPTPRPAVAASLPEPPRIAPPVLTLAEGATAAGAPGPAPRTTPLPGPAGSGALSPSPAPAAFTIREVPAPPAVPTAAPSSAAGAWPSGVLAGPEAERLLAAVVSGAATEPGPARATATQTAQALSDIERRALADIAVPVDAALFRRASALRLRVALALGAAPAVGSPIDSAAVQSLLAELDSTLAELKAAAEAGEGVHPGIEILRKSLVKEAIDLTDAVARIAPAQAPVVQAPVRPAAATRLLSNRSAVEEHARPPVGRGWMVLLVLAALAAGAFHGYRLLARKPVVPPPSFGGAPQDAVGVRQGPVSVVVPEAGKALDPRQVERFKALEEAKGNAVKEVAPGIYVSVPVAPAEGARKP
ncbi:MAG TPA: hypothetical protein VLD85_03100 [Anaeromyxobacteraceae bacterium]|nr:hypothetical protein [Anaeromyxobacteraceae bacterium]